MRAVLLMVAVCGSLAPAPLAWAGSAPQGADGAVPGLGTLGSAAGGLVLILALILALAWLLKRVGHLPGGAKGLVKVLGGASLGARERVMVVEVESTRLVLGVSPGRVEMLHVLQGPTPFSRQLADSVAEEAK